jgi:hypothetical protein
MVTILSRAMRKQYLIELSANLNVEGIDGDDNTEGASRELPGLARWTSSKDCRGPSRRWGKQPAVLKVPRDEGPRSWVWSLVREQNVSGSECCN